jgi:UDP-glucose 4-epimerase
VDYLITGGAGFIGSHLVEALLARGDSVVVLDNLSTGRPTNLDVVIDHPRFRFVHGSILDQLAVEELVRDAQMVVHLAAAVGVKLIVDQPLRSLTTNIRGSEIVLDAAHRYRTPILVASTSEIYGKNGQMPLVEDADRVLGAPTVARWAYSVAKSVDEILAYTYHRERDLPVMVTRFFNTVGPRQSPAYGMVIPRLVRQAVVGEPLTVYGDGSQTRCFCHVYDVIDALLGLLELLDHRQAVGEVFNVGATEEISIADLAVRVRERVGSASAIRYIAYEDAYESGFEDMPRRVPDTTKLQQLTGWRPRRTLVTILDDVIADAHSELELPVARR